MRLGNERSITSLVLLLVGVGLLSNTFGKDYADLGTAFSPMFFPRIILWGWVLLAVLDLASEVMWPKGADSPRLLRVAIIALGTLAFLWAMTRVGFFLAAVPFAVVALITLEVRRPLPLLAVSFGVPMALVALFNHVLTLPLPTSPFAWWF